MPSPAAGTLRLLAALALAASTGCAATLGGVTGWREVRSRNFVIRTDSWSENARAVAWDLESVHRAMTADFFRDLGDEPEPVVVVLFSSPLDFDRYAPAATWAYYEPDSRGRGTIVMPAQNATVQRTHAVHELAHHLAWRTYARQPPWLAEGLAGFMESLAPVWLDEFPTFAGMPRHLRGFGGFVISGSTAVVAARELHGEAEYRVAWALFHYLFSVEPDRLRRFLGHLQAGGDPTDAWLAVFPEWDPRVPAAGARLDAALMAHVGGYAPWGWRVGPAPQPVVTERPLSAVEVHELRLSLAWHNRGRPLADRERAAAGEQALAASPGSVSALAALAEARPAEALRHAEAAVRSHPEDERAWRLLAGALPPERTAEREAALRRALDVAPEAHQALTDLAFFLVQDGRSGEALPLANRAVRSAPRSVPALLALAAALDDLGRCPQALAALDRAVVVGWERGSDQLRDGLRRNVDRLERSCGDGVSAGAP